MKVNIENKFYIYFIAFFASICLTAVTIHLYPFFNPDGLLYLQGAETYLKQGLQASLDIYRWPFYQILIAYLHQLTTLSFLHVTYVFNAILTALMVITFIAIIDNLGGSIKILWLSLLVILIFHTLNNYRADLIRGHGYWLFYLLSLLCLIRFSKAFSWLAAIGWSVCILLATLFRVEGGLFLIFAPLVVWFFTSLSWQQRLFLYFKLNLITIIAIIAALLFINIHPVASHTLGRIPEFLGEFNNGLVETVRTFHHTALTLKTQVLTSLSADDADKFMFSGMIMIYMFTLLSILSLGYTIVLIYAGVKRSLPTVITAKLVIWTYIIINVLLTVVFYFQRLFLSGRYFIPLALTLLCYVPFGLVGMYRDWHNRPKRISIYSWLFPLVCLLMLGMAIGSLHCFGPSKIYLYNAAKWLNHNTEPTAIIYTNDERLGYFANRKIVGWKPNTPLYFSAYVQNKQLEKQPWKDSDYLVLDFNKHHLALEQQIEKIIGLAPAKIYSSKHGSSVFIFNLKNRRRK